MNCVSCHCADRFQCSNPSSTSPGSTFTRVHAFFAAGFPIFLGYASQKISKAVLVLSAVVSEVLSERSNAWLFSPYLLARSSLSSLALSAILDCSEIRPPKAP